MVIAVRKGLELVTVKSIKIKFTRVREKARVRKSSPKMADQAVPESEPANFFRQAPMWCSDLLPRGQPRGPRSESGFVMAYAVMAAWWPCRSKPDLAAEDLQKQYG